jgi:hypothetical protein
VVLSDGRVIVVNHDSHPDLFRALKGGGNNLGIVTQIELRAFAQGLLWGGLIGHPPDSITEQNQALVDLTGRLGSEYHAQIVTFWAYNGKSKSTTVASGLQHTLGQENPPIFQKFLSIPQTFSTLRAASIYDLMMETAPPPGRRALFLTLTFANNVEVLEYLRHLHNESISAIAAQVRSADWDFISFLQPFPTKLGRGSLKKENILGLDRMEKDHIGKSHVDLWLRLRLTGLSLPPVPRMG